MSSHRTPHILDRNIWHSLTTYHTKFATGTDLAKRYPADVVMFAEVYEPSAAAQHDLEQIVAPGEVLIVDGIQEAADLPGWTLLEVFSVKQMVCEQATAVPKSDETILELTTADVPEMIYLSEVSDLGAIHERTIDLGRYIGIRHEGQLVAMAGERLYMPGYHEISAVCTHPDFRGRGYARLLVSEMAAGHQRQGEVPFLHVSTENPRADSVYVSVGFRTRIEKQVFVIQR